MPPRAHTEPDTAKPALPSAGTEHPEPAGDEQQAVVAQGAAGAAGAGVGGGLRLPFELPGGVTGKRLLWLGGLAGAAALGALEWPVALAVGAGSLIAERLAREPEHPQEGGS